MADLLELTRAAPELLIHDLHPEYLSTKFAASSDLAPRLGVQHHHAHLASCLTDTGHRGPAIGVMFDGMGWGTDGTLWGGEILVGDANGYERFAHLRPVPMPGGTAAVRQPWRMALAHLFEQTGPDLPAIGSLAGHQEEAERVLDQCRPGRSILTTSVGRLFDSMAALCGLVESVTYEGQAAIRFEQAAGPDVRRYPVEISEGTPAVIEFSPLLHAVVSDLLAGQSPALIAGAFHRWVADAAVAASRQARESTGLSAVALSGGVFQNRRLVELLVPDLEKAGFEVLRHRQVPPNDGGIALGQAAIGRATLTNRG
ncbi:MAG: carbamoyltransferase HypF [Acidobacteria bacterium]|nr:carbamoyltransferase HypF [Acidobacteriota bacterium]